MLTQIVVLFLVMVVAVLAVGLVKQLGWLRKTIDSILARKPREEDELKIPESSKLLSTNDVVKTAAKLLREMISEEKIPAKRRRRQTKGRQKSRQIQ